MPLSRLLLVQVSFAISGFAPGSLVGLTECRADATDYRGCDLSHAQGWWMGWGDITGSYAVRARFSTANGPVECAQTGCVVGVANIFRQTDAAAVAIDFDPAQLNPPGISVVPSEGLTNGQSVQISGHGFDPNALVGFAECRAGAAGIGDCDLGSAWAQFASVTGAFTQNYFVRSAIVVNGQRLDCTVPDTCVLGFANLSNMAEGGTVPLSFT